jgi:hypothetical protein
VLRNGRERAGEPHCQYVLLVLPRASRYLRASPPPAETSNAGHDQGPNRTAGHARATSTVRPSRQPPGKRYAVGGMASGFLMTGHEVGAALGVAVLSAVASTAGSPTSSAGIVDGFARGFLAAAGIALVLAVFAYLRMPATRVDAGAGMHMHH